MKQSILSLLGETLLSACLCYYSSHVCETNGIRLHWAPRCPPALLTSETFVPSLPTGPPAGPRVLCGLPGQAPRPGCAGGAHWTPALCYSPSTPCPADPKGLGFPTSSLCLLAPVGPACPA